VVADNKSRTPRRARSSPGTLGLIFTALALLLGASGALAVTRGLRLLDSEGSTRQSVITGCASAGEPTPSNVSGTGGSSAPDIQIQQLQVKVLARPCAASGVQAYESSGLAVAIVLRLSSTQQTSCTIVLRYLGRRNNHDYYTRSRYCESHVHRGVWKKRGRATGLPHWAILTGAKRLAYVDVKATLIPTGAPLAHARLLILARSLRAKTTSLSITTNAHGQAKLALPYGPDRLLTAIYSGNTTYPGASTDVEADFPARATFFASTRFVAPGGNLSFNGTLLGAPYPASSSSGAARVMVQNLHSRKWVAVAAAVTHGAQWKTTLHIPQAMSPQALSLRALIAPSSSYPYHPGSSRILHIFVTRNPNGLRSPPKS
jgi:hypothetical protein